MKQNDQIYKNRKLIQLILKRNMNTDLNDMNEGFDEDNSPCETLAIGNINNDERLTNNTVQWLIEGKMFIAIGKTMPKLPAGNYNLRYHSSMQRYVPELMKVEADELLVLPDPALDLILRDITSFWKLEEHYKKYKYTYKRNILLYGDPGNGKSSVITLLSQILINEYKGIVISIKNSDDVQVFATVLTEIQEIEPDRRIIAVIEDIDNFVGSDRSIMTQLLNILDGNLQFKNLVVIATTNYPEKLESRISNRPSRFDRRYEIKNPNYAVRKYYLEHKLNKEDLESINIDEWVRATENFSIDHLKELLISVFVLGYKFDEAHAVMKDFVETKILKNTEKSKLGFGSK
jgi:energy-coupling factor transporter ATP-binding protein EcfA2